MKSLPTSYFRNSLYVAVFAIGALTTTAEAQLSPSSVASVRPQDCAVPLPLPPEDPSLDQDYNCYYWGSYTWNDGSGAGNVQGRIYWPSICGDGTTNPPGEFPLPTVLFMHGDGHSYTDYHYLMRHLAYNGFIVATISNSGTNLQRSAQALTYMNYMRNHWSKKDWVDGDNMGLIGHSRGGEAVLTLARRIKELGLTHNINSIISLAPTDSAEGGGSHETLVGSRSESFLVIYGTHDEDVTAPCLSGNMPECMGAPVEPHRSGFSLYDRAGSEGSTEPFPLYDAVVDKALVYIKGANHNGWRETCAGFPAIGNLSCATHRELAKGYMNAFLRWQLRGQEDYRHFFSGGFRLPIVQMENIAVSKSFQKGYDRRVVDNFQQAGWGVNTIGGTNSAESTVTILKDGTTWDYDRTSPHDSRSLTVSWSPPGLAPWMRFGIPDGSTLFGGRYRDVERFDYLSLRAGQVFESPLNTSELSKEFWVQLRDSSGGTSPWVKTSDYAGLPYPTEANVVKQGIFMTVAASEMSTVRIPLCRFSGIDKQNVSSVWFYFTASGSTTGEMFLDNIEFTD